MQSDHDALERSLAMARGASAAEAAHFDALLAKDNWEAAARGAAYSLQCHNLRLRPWMAPPCDVHADAEVSTLASYGHSPGEIALARRLRACGLSRFEPDPIAALERAEAKLPAA